MKRFQVGDFVVSVNGPQRGVIVDIEVEDGQQFCTIRSINRSKWYSYADGLAMSTLSDPIGVYQVGDRVQPNDHSGRTGVVIEVHDGRVKVKWDKKTSRQSRETTLVRPSALKMVGEVEA